MLHLIISKHVLGQTQALGGGNPLSSSRSRRKDPAPTGRKENPAPTGKGYVLLQQKDRLHRPIPLPKPVPRPWEDASFWEKLIPSKKVLPIDQVIRKPLMKQIPLFCPEACQKLSKLQTLLWERERELNPWRLHDLREPEAAFIHPNDIRWMPSCRGGKEVLSSEGKLERIAA